MIQLEGVSKVYQTARGPVRALDGVDLAIESGEFVALRGRSGSGKSTLLALVGGLALPTAGKVAVAGSELPKLSASERARFREKQIGFVFQMFHLLPYLTVLDNVLVAASEGDRQSAHGRAEELLNQFGLERRLWHRPAQLSAGERQRVALARALLNRPQLLLADEPTGNLDEYSAAAVLDWMTDFHRAGGTILLATHDPQAIERVQRSVELVAGRLAASAPVV